MAEGEKKYSLSLEQLNQLVSDAVATAIRKLDNVEIIDSPADKPAQEQTGVKVTEMDDEQYSEAIQTMDSE